MKNIFNIIDKNIYRFLLVNPPSKNIKKILVFFKKFFPFFSTEINEYMKLVSNRGRGYYLRAHKQHELKIFKPQNFSLQWHLTERCNWRCKHCYQGEVLPPELSLDNLFAIHNNFLFLIKKWNLSPGRVHINITGGEPFMRKDLFVFLEKIADGAKKFGYTWMLMSNGSMLNMGNLKRLKNLGIESIQVSLEGMQENNDKIRGLGAFCKTVRGIKNARKMGIPIRVNFTFNKENIVDTLPLIDLCCNLGVRSLGIKRLLPMGNGKAMERLMLQPKELKNYYLEIKKYKQNLLDNPGSLKNIDTSCESGVFSKELFSAGLGHNNCGLLFGRGLTIMANGDVLPCRRLPIVINSALKESLYNIYYSKQVRDLMDVDSLHPFCRRCSNFYYCLGGAKCVNYAYNSNYNIPDIQCWNAYKEINKPLF